MAILVVGCAIFKGQVRRLAAALPHGQPFADRSLSQRRIKDLHNCARRSFPFR
jgi:hypothetical protein